MFSRRNFMFGATAVALAAPHLILRSAAASAPIVRRDVMDMNANDRFFSDYAKAVQNMHQLSDGRSWLAQAKIHADYCHHGEPEFLHWHRHYLRFFEKICADLSGNPDFALPYWNWSKNSGKLPAPFFDLPELNVEHWKDPGQYVGKAWGPVDSVGRRALDKTHGLMSDPARAGAFTLAKINGIKRLPSIDLFHPALEGEPHNTAHVVVGATRPKGGHMGSGLSPLDPIFWLHHCMVDRVWAEWQSTGHDTPDPQSDYSGQFVDVDGSAAHAGSTGAMNISDLNYTYDILQRPPAAVAGRLSAEEIKTLSQVLRPRPAQSVGSGSNSKTSRPNLETAIEVAAPGIPAQGSEFRELESVAGTTGGRRLLAKLSDVVHPEKDDLLVNVFVDCPYLAPSTPASDPHYAGTFSFFGAAKAMAGMPGMKSQSYVVDITEPVRQGGFDTDKIRVQLMPLAASPDGESNSTFQVGKVEILSV